MTPTLVTPPADPVVLPDDLRLYLRVDHDDDLTLIESLGAAAVAHLDGWTGVLGRCIMPQTWQIAVDAAGEVVLPMPDVTAASADYGAGPVALAVTASALGPVVDVTDSCTVTFTCSMPAHLLPGVQAVVKMLVAHWYANREAVAMSSATELPLAVNALIMQMRWARI